MKKIISFSAVLGALIPMLTLAEGAGGTVESICGSESLDNVTGIIGFFTCALLNSILPFLFALAIAAFIWGVIQFYLNPENEEKRKKGKSFIVGGLIALFVMGSVWALVGILSNTFDTGDAVIPYLPE